MKRYALLLPAFVLVAIPALAQDPATGFPPYGSVEAGRFDAVNLQNLNVNFGFPIVHIPGRGLDFNFAVVYDSLIWRKVNNAWVSVSDANGNPTWGWKTNTPFGAVLLDSNLDSCLYLDDYGFPQTEYTTRYDNYRYVDPAGTVHPFIGIRWYSNATHCRWQTPVGPDGITGTTAPGISLDVGSGVLSIPDGTAFTGSSLTDTNGNYISIIQVSSSETDLRDTANHTALRMITNGSNIEYHYLDTTGTDRVITLKFQNYNVKTNFGCSSVVEYNGSGTRPPVNLPYELDLPNNQTYVLSYELTPGVTQPPPSSPPIITGRLASVTLLTAGRNKNPYRRTAP